MTPLSALFSDPATALETGALLLSLLCLSIQIVGTEDRSWQTEEDDQREEVPEPKERLLTRFEVGRAISLPKRCLQAQHVARAL